MSRIYGPELLKKVKIILEEGRLNDDGSITTYSNLLDEESAETGLNLEHLLAVSVDYMQGQYPEACIRFKNSKVETEELSLDIENTTEDYPIDICIMLIDNEDIYTKQEYYIKCLQKLFHGYQDEDIVYIVCTGCIRGTAYNEQEQIFKVMGVELEARI